MKPKTFILGVLCGLCVIKSTAQLLPPRQASAPKAAPMAKPSVAVNGSNVTLAATLQLVWDQPSSVWLRVVSRTNLASGQWVPVTNLYPVFPTNQNILNAMPQEFFRLEMYGLNDGTNLQLRVSNVITNN